MKKSDARLVAEAVALSLKSRLVYRGEFRAGQEYRRGNLVSHEGSVWHCNADGTKHLPAVDLDCWTLAVKRGKDGVNSNG